MTLMDHDLGTPRPRTTSRDQVLQTVELVPFVLGRNRRTQGHASLVHHACYAWHVG